MDEITKEVVFYNADLFYTLEICGPANTQVDPNCLKMNLSDFSLQVKTIFYVYNMLGLEI